VLSHEAIVDAAWPSAIRPLLLARFPNATPDQLREAHGYAYGGAIIQDMGYYPHGSKFFSDLTHYVRSGDFIATLIRDSQDLDGYAFALGALAHYAADNNGHKLAVNKSVPMLYPKVRKKVGNVATYEDNPADHLKMEFGFDVLEVAKGRYAPDAYHDFIGFNVDQPLLERAFQETYGVPMRSIFTNLDKALGSYRYDVSTLIPRATKIAWVIKKDEIERDQPTMTQKKFLYNLSRASYEKNWGTDYQRPGLGAKILAFLIRILPKIGPLRALTFKTPTPQTETLFMSSFNVTLEQYKELLKNTDDGSPTIKNTNFDIGEPVEAGQYFMADDTYAKLLDQLAKQQFANVTPELRENILNFYANPTAPIATKKNEKQWARVNEEIAQLKKASPVPVAAPAATGTDH
jgi:Zinc dependent phospholipase C